MPALSIVAGVAGSSGGVITGPGLANALLAEPLLGPRSVIAWPPAAFAAAALPPAAPEPEPLHAASNVPIHTEELRMRATYSRRTAIARCDAGATRVRPRLRQPRSVRAGQARRYERATSAIESATQIRFVACGMVSHVTMPRAPAPTRCSSTASANTA